MVGSEYVRSLRAGLVRCVVVLAPVLGLVGGCATTPLPPPPPPVALMPTWNPNVAFLPDSINGGRRTAALVGHLYMQDAKGNVIAPDDGGTLMVQVLEEHPLLGPDGTPMVLEAWKITPECLKQSMVKDPIGPGYTLVVPWSTYRPDIGRLEFRVSYLPKDPKASMPVYSDSLVTLQNSGGNMGTAPVVTSSGQLQPQMSRSGYGQGPIQQAGAWQNQTSTMQIERGPQPGSVQVMTGGQQGMTPTTNHLASLSSVGGMQQSTMPSGNAGGPIVQQVSNSGPPMPSVVIMPQSCTPPSVNGPAPSGPFINMGGEH